MKIVGVKTLVVNAEMRHWVFVRVETNETGLYGGGDATLECRREATKIAAWQRTLGSVAPHNPLGPLAIVAALHFESPPQNFVIQEEMARAVPGFAEVLEGLPRLTGG